MEADNQIPFNYEQVVRDWKWDIPEYFNIAVDCVDKNAGMPGRADRVCLYWENREGTSRGYTYEDMRLLSNRFGNVLKKLGLRKGDRLVIRLPNVPEFHTAMLGAMKTGVLPIPCSTMFRAKEMEYLLEDSGASAVVTTAQYADAVMAARSGRPGLNHILITAAPVPARSIRFDEVMEKAPDELEVEQTRSDDPAFICYTSGTTAAPKGVVHAHRWLIGNDPGTLYWQNVTEDDLVAHTSQLNWIFTFSNGFLFPWRHGASTLIYDGPFDPRRWFELIEKYGASILVSVPTAYRMLLSDHSFSEGRDLSKLRHCISAGEPLTPEVLDTWRDRFGHTIHDGIGMTEHTVYLTNMPGIEVRRGSCGRPQPGHPCGVVDRDGNELGPGIRGILATRRGDPSLFLEYWNKPGLTEESFAGEWHLSGDVVYRTGDGYYYFCARDDDLIMSAGYRISPFEVESAVNMHPAVLESAAVASPDETRGVVVKVFISLNEGYEPGEELAEDIRLFAKKAIAPYKQPRRIEFVEELPKTASGKIKRKMLREKERDNTPPE